MRKVRPRALIKVSRRADNAVPPMATSSAPAAAGLAAKSVVDSRVNNPTPGRFHLDTDPFCWTPHLAGLFDRQVLIAPLVTLWKYQVGDRTGFCDWLATRDIVLNDRRLSRDARLAGIRYCGTYITDSSVGSGDPAGFGDPVGSGDPACSGDPVGPGNPADNVDPAGSDTAGKSDLARCTTIWGFATREAMLAMHNLCVDRYATRTIVQNDLYAFVAGLRAFVAYPHDGGFEQDVLVSSAAGLGSDSDLGSSSSSDSGSGAGR